MAKYKLTWKDLSWNDFKIYLFSLFKAFVPKKKLTNLGDLEDFIRSKSAWVAQVTLYGYLKTRMGTRYVLHFENDTFMKSVNLAKWNIYAVALQDLTFYSFSYLKNNLNYQDIDKAKEIFFKILDDEIMNQMPLNIIEEAKKEFDERLFNINWDMEIYAYLKNNKPIIIGSECIGTCKGISGVKNKIVYSKIKTSTSSSDIVDQLNSLNELYKSGVLTKEEFEKAKKKILN